MTPQEHVEQIKQLANSLAEHASAIAEGKIATDRWHAQSNVILNQSELLQAWTAPRFLKES